MYPEPGRQQEPFHPVHPQPTQREYFQQQQDYQQQGFRPAFNVPQPPFQPMMPVSQQPPPPDIRSILHPGLLQLSPQQPPIFPQPVKPSPGGGFASMDIDDKPTDFSSIPGTLLWCAVSCSAFLLALSAIIRPQAPQAPLD